MSTYTSSEKNGLFQPRGLVEAKKGVFFNGGGQNAKNRPGGVFLKKSEKSGQVPKNQRLTVLFSMGSNTKVNPRGFFNNFDKFNKISKNPEES